MLINIHPDNPEQNKIVKVVDAIRKGGIAIIPTDSVYAFCCDLKNKTAVEKICHLKNIKPDKANFSILCSDLSNLSDFTSNISKSIFKILKPSDNVDSFFIQDGIIEFYNNN